MDVEKEVQQEQNDNEGGVTPVVESEIDSEQAPDHTPVPDSSGAPAETASATETEEIAPPKNERFRYYVIHTYSGYEERAKQSLFERAKRSNAESKFGNVIIPTATKELVTKTGKKRQISKTQFPGYMLVEMDLTEETMVIVKDTPRITGFVGNQRNPRPLPEREILRYLSTDFQESEDTDQTGPEMLFEKGESVKVVDGPFSNFDGIVDEVKPDKARLRVLVSIFGRETPVELEYSQVEKLS